MSSTANRSRPAETQFFFFFVIFPFLHISFLLYSLNICWMYWWIEQIPVALLIMTQSAVRSLLTLLSKIDCIHNLKGMQQKIRQQTSPSRNMWPQARKSHGMIQADNGNCLIWRIQRTSLWAVPLCWFNTSLVSKISGDHLMLPCRRDYLNKRTLQVATVK